MKNIYLIGFMGCGKSTIGSALSKQFQMQLLDVDEAIVQEEKRSIAEIFLTDGEVYFRDVETKVLLDTQHLRQHVIATGGGVIEREQNRNYLSTQEVIYLKWPFEILYQRICQDTTRPLATSYESLKERYNKRSAYYEDVATLVVECEGHTPFSLVEKLDAYYKERRRIIK